MDWEFKIQVMERELAHLREMKDLHNARLNAGDARHDALEALVTDLGKSVTQLTVNVTVLAAKIDTLVQALLAPHSNGGPK